MAPSKWYRQNFKFYEVINMLEFILGFISCFLIFKGYKYKMARKKREIHWENYK
jgi:hypothetical protein